jgi:CBS-domain-containing membrane protein
VHSHGRKVGEIMTSEVTTVSEDALLEDVVKIMEHRRIKRVPVTRGDKLVGIISLQVSFGHWPDWRGKHRQRAQMTKPRASKLWLN